MASDGKSKTTAGCLKVLNVASSVVEYVVQELQEVRECNEKKLKSTTDKWLNLAQRSRECRRRGCAGARPARSIVEKLQVRMGDFARDSGSGEAVGLRFRKS